MSNHSAPRRLVLGAAAIAFFASSIASPTLGINTVSQQITGGGLTASIADLSLASVAYQSGEHDVVGTMVLTATDDTTARAGWNVTVMTSDFVFVGSAAGGVDIPAVNFALTSADAPVWISGDVINVAANTGPQVPSTTSTATLEVARKVLHATAGYGAGSYRQNLNVALTIPELSRVGTYTGTLTVTITAAP